MKKTDHGSFFQKNAKNSSSNLNKTRHKAIKTTENLLFENQIWRIGEVADYTGYAPGTIYNLVSRDLIPHRKKRGRLYFIPCEIRNWIDEGDI